MGNRYSKKYVQNLERLHNERMEKMSREHKEMIGRMEQSLAEIKKKTEEQQLLLQKPVIERQAKVDLVNSLQLKVRETDALLLLGPKGTGKSTFMWLLGRGHQPSQTFGDGTVEMTQLEGYVDSIGLRGWTNDELLKVLVVMIYRGIPKDMILFSSTDRLEYAITALGLVGITHPLIVIMSGDFWKNFNKQRIQLVEDNNGVKRVQPLENLDDIYRLDIYSGLTDLNLGMPLTHHDDIQYFVNKRSSSGVTPFKVLMETLGSTFQATMEIDHANNLKELLFRFIYIYEKVYAKDELKFMNTASLQDFV